MSDKAQIHVALMGRCDDCFGIGLKNRLMPKTPENTCSRCKGTGDVFERVCCASCAHFESGVTPIAGTGMCHYDEDICVFADWGCKGYESRETPHEQ